MTDSRALLSFTVAGVTGTCWRQAERWDEGQILKISLLRVKWFKISLESNRESLTGFK